MNARDRSRLPRLLGLFPTPTPLRATILAAALVLLVPSLPALGGWWDDAGAASHVSLDDLIARRADLTDIPVLLRARVGAESDAGARLPGTLASASWTRLTARPGRRSKRSADAAPGLLVVEPDSLIAQRAQSLDPGTTVVIRGVLRGVVDGRPVLEMLAVTAPGDPLTPEEHAQLVRADHLLNNENAAGAEAIYQRLLRSREFATVTAVELHKKVGIACGRLGRIQDAAIAFRRASTLAPKDVGAARALKQAEEALEKGLGNDRGATPTVETDLPPGMRRLAGPGATPAAGERSTAKPTGKRPKPAARGADTAAPGDTAPRRPPPVSGTQPPATDPPPPVDPDEPPPPPRPRLRGPK